MKAGVTKVLNTRTLQVGLFASYTNMANSRDGVKRVRVYVRHPRIKNAAYLATWTYWEMC